MTPAKAGEGGFQTRPYVRLGGSVGPVQDALRLPEFDPRRPSQRTNQDTDFPPIEVRAQAYAFIDSHLRGWPLSFGSFAAKFSARWEGCDWGFKPAPTSGWAEAWVPVHPAGRQDGFPSSRERRIHGAVKTNWYKLYWLLLGFQPRYRLDLRSRRSLDQRKDSRKEHSA